MKIMLIAMFLSCFCMMAGEPTQQQVIDSYIKREAFLQNQISALERNIQKMVELKKEQEKAGMIKRQPSVNVVEIRRKQEIYARSGMIYRPPPPPRPAVDPDMVNAQNEVERLKKELAKTRATRLEIELGRKK